MIWVNFKKTSNISLELCEEGEGDLLQLLKPELGNHFIIGTKLFSSNKAAINNF